MRAIEPRGGPEDVRRGMLSEAPQGSAPSPRAREEIEGGHDESGANEDFLFHLYRGSELLQDNRVLDAKGELERALHLQPRDTKGQDLLAVVYFRLGLYPRAIAIYERLLADAPRDPSLLLNLALCLLKTGQPALAKLRLLALVETHPEHARAWGYLGLAHDRLGELTEAEAAFRRGGHPQMVRRVENKRNSLIPPADESFPPHDLREAAASAFEELDAGALTFALAEPAVESRPFEGDWRPLELGHTPASVAPERPRTERPAAARLPAPAMHLPHLGVPSEERRPTLIVGVAPAPEDAAAAMPSVAIPAPRAPTFALDEAGAPSLLVPPLAADVPAGLDAESTKWTAAPPKRPEPDFPANHGVFLHPSGVALARIAASAPFTARIDVVRSYTSHLVTELTERRIDGRGAGAPLGGLGSPMIRISGDGRVVLGPHTGRRLVVLPIDDVCFVREDALVGWGGSFEHDTGHLPANDREGSSVVQLRGHGSVVVESFGEVLQLDVRPHGGLHVRREALLGWVGRLVPTAISTSDAPCGQRGLLGFSGTGYLLVTSS